MEFDGIGEIAETVSPGEIIDCEAVVEDSMGVTTKQRWYQFWIGEKKIWVRENEITREHLSEENQIFGETN